MPAPTRRRTASPDADDLAGLDAATPVGGRLRKAPVSDPVLGVAGTSAREPETAKPSPRPDRRPAPATAPTKVKAGFYQDPGDTARARAAFSWTRPQEGHRSFSDFVAAALMREVERLEAEYHHGEPWPPMEPGELPTGKPLGAVAPSARAVAPAPNRQEPPGGADRKGSIRQTGAPSGQWLLLEGPAGEGEAVLGQFKTEREAERALHRHRRKWPNAAHPVRVGNTRDLTRRQLLNPPPEFDQ